MMGIRERDTAEDCGGMQDRPLRVTQLIDHAEREHGDREIVTHWANGRETRSSWANVATDARRLAAALTGLGLGKGDRIATLAMNHERHLVTWYGAIGMGGVIHTVNPRLFDDQIAYILNHGGARVLFYDHAFAPIIGRLRPRLTELKHYFEFDPPGEGIPADNGRPTPSFAQLIAGQDDQFQWIDGDERDPCMLCYTSGTTGNPKGVLYQHRSTMLHALTGVQPDLLDLSRRSVILPIVPMFHAAAWGLPFGGALVGAKFVFSAVNDPVVLTRLMNEEHVTHSAGVPTVWMSMFQHIDGGAEPPRHLKLVTIGGSACPRPMIERLMTMGARVSHIWGMTETSPLGAAGSPGEDWENLDLSARVDHVSRQGKAPFGVELRIVDDEDRDLGRDGQTSGRLQVRGPWVVRRYYRAERDTLSADGWFDTGDIARVHPCGTMEITDRAKDVIKSGGEWISSVDLENAAMNCPGVAEAAAIGIPHPQWDERPLLLVVRKPGAELTADAVRATLATRVAKWWLPDAIVFVDSLPHTATGKLQKTALRELYPDLESAKKAESGSR